MKTIRVMLGVVLIFGLLLPFPTAVGAQVEKINPVQPGPEDMYGIWEGEGSQTNGERWSIRATLKPGRYRIEYPSLSCGGSLAVVEKTAGYLRAIEKITSGRDKCYNGGVVVLVWKKPGVMDFLWYYPDGGNGAMGELKKVR